MSLFFVFLNPMKILFISDTHTFQRELIHLPEADVICCSGDFCLRGEFEEGLSFIKWFSELPYKHKVFIAGNHDICFDSTHKRFEYFQKIYKDYKGEFIEDITQKIPKGVHYLMKSEVVIDGVKFWGAPYTPWFHNWAFNLPRDSEEIREVWAQIPEDVDVLLTHGPAFKILDYTFEGLFVGCESLAEKLNSLKPPIFSFGHIHESYGYNFVSYPESEKITLAINSSVVNRRYWVINPPVLVEYDKKTGVKKVIDYISVTNN